MLVKKSGAVINTIEKPRGGVGTMNAAEYLKTAQIRSKLSGFNLMTLSVGGEIGYHQHVGNEEVYFIVSGKGLVKDNGVESEVVSGDVIFTGHEEFHGLKNIGEEELVFAAFIVGF